MRIPTLFLSVLATFLVGCTHAETNTAAQPATLRVLTYNVHHCEGTDGKLDVPRIAAIIKDSGADLVALQEIDVLTKRVPVDEPAELARLTGLHVAFGKAIDLQGGAYGQVLLSRWPLEDVRVDKLANLPDREQRIALSARTAGLRFVSTHLDHQLDDLRQKQAAELLDLFGAKSPGDSRLILAGDLNSNPDSAPISILHRDFIETDESLSPTIPSKSPRHKIDYVLLRTPARWTVARSQVLPEPIASDHRPVLVEIRPISAGK